MAEVDVVTPLTVEEVRESFATIRECSAPICHELLDVLERRLILDESLLALQARIDTVTEGLYAGYSRKVPDVPALRLVGNWEADARSTSLAEVRTEEA